MRARPSTRDEDGENGRAEIELVLDVPVREVPHATALEEQRFERFDNEPDMVLGLDAAWTSYDDYPGALNTKYRKAAREIDKRLAKEGCTLERNVDVTRHADAIHALYLVVHSRSPFRFVTAGENFTRRLRRDSGSASP